jgi:hypothetical protein
MGIVFTTVCPKSSSKSKRLKHLPAWAMEIDLEIKSFKKTENKYKFIALDNLFCFFIGQVE